jgi:DNA-binding NtrC family response regulator
MPKTEGVTSLSNGAAPSVSAMVDGPPASSETSEPQPVSSARADTAPAPQPIVTDLSTLERRHIESTLSSVGGDKTLAAQLLGISRRTLERRVAEWAAQSQR